MLNAKERVALFMKIVAENGEVGPLYFKKSIHEELMSLMKKTNFDLWTAIEATCTKAYSHPCYDTPNALLSDEEKVKLSVNEKLHLSYPQTEAKRRRSVFDIFRMVQGLGLPNSILEVMECLYEHGDEFNISVCCTVGRRVFRLNSAWNEGVSSTSSHDEFGLQFDNWSNITTEEGGAVIPTQYMYDPTHKIYRDKYESEFRPVKNPVKFDPFS